MVQVVCERIVGLSPIEIPDVNDGVVGVGVVVGAGVGHPLLVRFMAGTVGRSDGHVTPLACVATVVVW